MKKITYFKLPLCMYCNEANRWITEVMYEHPEYADVEIEVIDEVRNRKLAKQYDYYFVPTFYVDGQKIHEGAASKEIVEQVLKKAYEGND